METPGETGGAPTARSAYPRPLWLMILRQVLGWTALLGGPIYLVALIQALVQHTLLTTDRTLIDPRTLLWYIPLMGAGGWALLDLVREGKFLRARRRAALREPFEQYWQRQLVAARAKGDQQAELGALSNVGFWLIEEERYEEARPYLEATLALARELGNRRFQEERALYGLGVAAFQRGDPDTAEDLLRQSLAVATTLDVKRLDERADIYAHVGEFLCAHRDKREEGCQMLAEAQAIYHALGQAKARWLEDEQHMRELRRQYGDSHA